MWLQDAPGQQEEEGEGIEHQHENVDLDEALFVVHFPTGATSR